ncbi:MAG: 50S ribosomal protein L15 [Spirochaetota bacterium]
MEEQYSLKRPGCNKEKKRVGRGTSSGHGKTSCRGQKGQLSRSGSKKMIGFEGGQMPLQRRVPKRGFNSAFKKNYQVVNLSQIINIEIQEITPEVLVKLKIIKSSNKLVKILGKGVLNKPVKIVADAFSASASKMIQGIGGEAVLRQANKK